jgi:hypothetical protein
MVDFSSYSNFGNDPRRAEQLRIASAIDLNRIAVVSGPPGAYGFRKGTWTFKYDGAEYKFLTSVPHAAEPEKQNNMVRAAAALHIAGLQSGYIGS